MAICQRVVRIKALLVLMAALVCCEKPDIGSRPSPKTDPIIFKPATDLTDAIRRGEISSLDLVNRYVENIQRLIDAAITKTVRK